MRSIDRKAEALQRNLDTLALRSLGPAADGGARLGVNELAVIRALGAEGTQAMSALARAIGIRVSTMTSVADGLERKGLAQRVRGTDDRRRVELTLTDAGRRRYRRLVEDQLKLCREMLASFSEREQDLLVDLLARLSRP